MLENGGVSYTELLASIDLGDEAAELSDSQRQSLAEQALTGFLAGVPAWAMVMESPWFKALSAAAQNSVDIHHDQFLNLMHRNNTAPTHALRWLPDSPIAKSLQGKSN